MIKRAVPPLPHTEEEFRESQAFWREFFGEIVRELDAERFWYDGYSDPWDEPRPTPYVDRFEPIDERVILEKYAPHLGRVIQLFQIPFRPHKYRIAGWTKDMPPRVEGVAAEVLLCLYVAPTDRILRRLGRVLTKFLDPSIALSEALLALDSLEPGRLGERGFSRVPLFGTSAAETGLRPAVAGFEERRLICARRWGIQFGAELSGGSLASVCECRGPSGEDLVLKLSPMWTGPATEAAALRAWGGRGAARLVDFAEDISALLLERIRPGTYLLERDRSSTRLPGSDELAIAAASGVLIEIQSAPMPTDGAFPSFAEKLRWWLNYTATYGETDAAGTPMLPLMERAALALDASAKRKTLAHGDFIGKNLLLGLDGRYVAIDPLPFVGDPCSDIGQFSAYHSPVATVVARARAIAERTGNDPGRAARWAAVWMIGEACETWREDSDELQAWVVGEECQSLLASC